MTNNLPKENELAFLRSLPVSMAFDEEKESFLQWRKKAESKLSELLGMEYFTTCEDDFSVEYTRETPEYILFRFNYQSERNYYVPAMLLVPKKTRYKKPPLMICLQGHGTGMHISIGEAKYENDENKIKNGDRDFALQAVEHGFCALALDQRNFGEKGGNPRPVCHSASLIALLTGRTIIGGRVFDVMRAVDTVTAHFAEYFDSEKIYCMGNSGGGTCTLYATALEDRIKGAICSCAFGSFEKSIGEQNHCECNYIPNIRRYFDMAEIGGMCYPKPMVIVSGMTDGIFPIEGAKEEFLRLQETYYKNASLISHVIGEEGHRFYKKQAWTEFLRLITEK